MRDPNTKIGRNLAFRTLPEVRRGLRDDAEHQAERRGIGGAELRGTKHLLNRIVCHYLSLGQAERDRVNDVGGAIWDRLIESDRELPIRPEIEPSGSVEGGSGVITPRPIGSSGTQGRPQKRRRKRKPDGMDKPISAPH